MISWLIRVIFFNLVFLYTYTFKYLMVSLGGMEEVCEGCEAFN